MSEQPTLREWYEQFRARFGTKNDVFTKAAHKWPEKTPYGIVSAGAPRPWLWFFIWLGLIAFWICVQVYNQYLRQVLINYPEYLSQIDFDFVDSINQVAFVAIVLWIILTSVMFFYMTLNTWGGFDTQFEPCIVWTLNGIPMTVVLRMDDNEELWPLPKNHDLIKWLERLEEEEMEEFIDGDKSKGRTEGSKEETGETTTAE